jgi:hypothetical protein
MSTTRILATRIHAGPIRHQTLPDDLVARIRWIHDAFADVDGKSLDARIDAFRRDADPEGEVVIWQHLAMAHLAYRHHHPSLTFDQKREALAVLVHLSMGVERRRLEHLDEHASSELRALFAGLDQ